MMGHVMSVLAGILGVYMVLVCIRIFLTWFPGTDFGRPYLVLCSICDPYLNWFRRFRPFKNSPLDFSPIIALAALSLIHRIVLSWGRMGRISIAAVLVMILGAVWSVVSWVLGFFIVILILRMIAFLANCNIYSPFWRLVDFIAQPLMYRIGRIFFPARLIAYLWRIILSIVFLLAAGAAVKLFVYFAVILLKALPF